jgi:hypothetical protein
MANSRIINGALSASPSSIFLRIPIDTPFEDLFFQDCNPEYLKSASPRMALFKWLSYPVVADKGYISMRSLCSTRNVKCGQLLAVGQSQSYCLEVAKQLNVHYRFLPVDLKYSPAIPISDFGNDND